MQTIIYIKSSVLSEISMTNLSDFFLLSEWLGYWIQSLLHVVTNVLVSEIVMSECKLEVRYYVYFRTNTHE